MERPRWRFHDGDIFSLLEARRSAVTPADTSKTLQFHSSLLRRLALEKELEGHEGCVNAISWNSEGSMLLSGSDDTRINIWGFAEKKLLHSVDTGHSANIFCTKFVPGTSDELVVSGAGDAEVRVFNLSRLNGRRSIDLAPRPAAVYQCHSRRVKKLAVENGNPHVIWSASEDGTLRQHDFRESSSCPPAGSSNQECRNVLLDLRFGAKKSLADSPKHLLALKSCDISSSRPHHLLVGGSDAFARLYDRRMLPSLRSSQLNTKSPPCVNFFCPLHLAERRKSSLHLTHVVFSPIGEEVLISYSGEHAYLMDVDVGTKSLVKYAADDVKKQLSVPNFAKAVRNSPKLCTVAINKHQRKDEPFRLDTCRHLIEAAAKCLETGLDLLYGVEACNEVLHGKGHYYSRDLMLDCLCIRAALLLKRKWKNDVHMAMRDCRSACLIDPMSFKAHCYMAEALLQLGRLREAYDYADGLSKLVSSISEEEQVRDIKSRIVAVEVEKSKKDYEASKDDARRARIRSLTDILFRPDAGGASQEGGHDDHEDSDDDDEMELDFETAISGDESHESETGVVRGSVSLRFHRRDDSAMAKCGEKGSQEDFSNEPEVAIDMKQRYVAHCNIGTDIKQASFLGQQGEFVASGSDDGRWFIWEKRTGRLMKMLSGDEAVVNCIQSHPFDCAVATSGIDNSIKLWTPTSNVPSIVAGGAAGPENDDVMSVIESNQRKLSRNREILLPVDFLERFRVNEFVEGIQHPFECAQS